jgi:hypothetical protein
LRHVWVSQMLRAGFSTEEPWRGGLGICWKRWLDANAAIQGRSGTREPDESRDGSSSSGSYRSLPGEDEPGSCLISNEHFSFLFIVLVLLTVFTRNLEDIRDCASIHTYGTYQKLFA